MDQNQAREDEVGIFCLLFFKWKIYASTCLLWQNLNIYLPFFI